VKIRWVNDVMMPLPSSNAFMRFVCRYPGLFLLPAAACAGLAVFFHHRLTELDDGQRAGVYVGQLKVLRDLFGTTGVVGFFVVLVVLWLYLFWVYAIHDPGGRSAGQ
jgi:hypothetical protein